MSQLVLAYVSVLIWPALVLGAAVWVARRLRG